VDKVSVPTSSPHFNMILSKENSATAEPLGESRAARALMR